ncbi:MAG: large Ala/Glu-rich protein [Bdellovibrio sp. ArHS]|uniref:FHA domain-containing protein n=1 Tax=Bdellovibrio sp. ArHS TaxID=1569284 RepID=UPI0005835AA4|nr:FHA domain-containing protein [Bdellovibrio sp. ArHS]KHD89389.1 MAG: large Ala/Glu-rich protein [Bdellovibrio sp. ArHS]
MNKFIVTIQRKDQVLSREVNKDSFTIGRSVDCDIALNDNHISRVHLVVSRRWNQIWIEDKNSSNGTFINGTKIVQGTPVNVVLADKIQLGRSEYLLTFDLNTTEMEEPLSSEEVAVSEEPVLPDTVAMPPPNTPQFQAEKVLHEAKRKAAQIILEGETQAEKRVQAIYQKAREAQSQAEYFYQTRMAEAHKEADAILSDFQNQGRQLLTEARKMAQELREEVDMYVQSLKDKAKTDTEDLISEATLAAEKMKSEALESGRLAAQSEADGLLRGAREEAQRILEFSQLQTSEVQEKLKLNQEAVQVLAKELIEVEDKLRNAQSALADAEQKNFELAEKSFLEEQRAEAVLKSEAQRLQELHASEEARIRELLQLEEAKMNELKAAQQQFAQDKKKLEEANQALQEKQAHLSMDVRDLEAKKSHLFKEYDAQKIFLNEKLEKEKSQMAKSEEERLEEMRLEMSKRLLKMEQDLLHDVIQKKTSLIKEIHAAVEKEIVLLMEPTQWRNISATVENHIKEAIEEKVASLAQSSTVLQAKPVDLLKKRQSEKLRWASVGLAMGALVYFFSQVVIEKMSSDQAPMQSLVAQEAKKRQEDLEKRKFNPPQAEEIKDSYTDAVIYTRNYPAIYTDEQFQQKLYRAASQYLLKTWRVDEDKSIQVISTANALVKELHEKRSKIHPDFIKEGIEKMRVLEKESLARMKEVLGSEVRVESFRRFERNFYKEEVQRRRMAQH